MSEANKEVKLSLKVMINKENSKVLFAEADGQFVDILLSFLTLPLGRIPKVLEKHYGDKAPAIGSLSSLYHSLANLDASHFWTNGAKEVLLDPTSSFQAECERLKMDITDSPPAEYFCCSYSSHERLRCVSIYYDHDRCARCYNSKLLKKKVANEGCEAATCTDGAFTIQTASFIISEDLQIFPSETGLLPIITTLGITDMDNAHPIKLDFGFTEFMKLFKASLTSPTPLSDIILNKTTRMSPTATQPMIAKQDDPNSGDLLVKVMIQESTGKLLYAQANKNFIEFLFGLLVIPLGGVEYLLSGETCFEAINNLYWSTANRIPGEHFMEPQIKERLIQSNLPHGYISGKHILSLREERLPFKYIDSFSSRSDKFPKGKGSYLQGPQTYEVKDDLTVTPFCMFSISSNLIKQKIPISDVKEVELQIGLKECLSILKASLASNSALTDALLTTQILPNQKPKPEPRESD